MAKGLSFDEYLALLDKARSQKDFQSETSILLHTDLFQHIVRLSDCGEGIIEVGCYKGGASVLFAYLCKKFNWPFFTLDVSLDYLEYTKNLLYSLDLVAQSIFYHGTLMQFAVEERLEKNPVLVFVDGDHSYSAVVKDIETIYQLNRRPYAAAFHDFSLRCRNPAHKNTLVDRAIQDCFGPNVDYIRIGVQFSNKPVPSKENPGPEGEYWERNGTEGVIIEMSKRELQRSYNPTLLMGEVDIVIGNSLPRPSPDLRNIPFLPYRIKPSRQNLSGVVLIPMVDGTESKGVFGIEIVSPEKKIICQTTVPFSQVKSYLPVRFNFPAIMNSHQGVFELRVFARGAQKRVRVLESRFLPPLRGLHRWLTWPLCGMIFSVSSEKEEEDQPHSDKNDSLNLSTSPYFLKSYKKQTEELLKLYDETRAMSLAVGGEFDAVGLLEYFLLLQKGLLKEHTVVDVGCGSGRLAFQLREYLTGLYIGIDIVPELLHYAQKISNRPDWRFYVGPGLKIPEPDESADFICFFSVFTHLLHEETFKYLEEAKRVIKPNGKIIFSFLEFSIPSHWVIFQSSLNDNRPDKVLNQFISRDAIKVWVDHLGLSVIEIIDGDTPNISLNRPVRFENGGEMIEKGIFTQSVCELTKK